VLASVTPREERVLRMRFGIGMNKDHTLEEVGQQFSFHVPNVIRHGYGDRTAWLGWEDSNSEMSSQNIPLKGRTDFRDPAEFRPQRLFAFELRRWEAQLENSIKRHRYTP
jgi:Sigma-70, region 4